LKGVDEIEVDEAELDKVEVQELLQLIHFMCISTVNSSVLLEGHVHSY